MAYSDHIQDLITAAKAMPNGLNKNKMISHLEDAKAHAIVLEGYVPGVSPEDAANSPIGANPFCLCKPGVIDNSCPVHGKK